MREKLIELIAEAKRQWEGGTNNIDARIVDHLIANGVTIPVPCKKCVHAQLDDMGNLWCWGTMRVFGDYFCANGATPLPEPPKEE